MFLSGAGLPPPLAVSHVCGETRHAQVGRMVEALGDCFAREAPAAVLVQGDTNTASAAAQAGSYVGAPVVHVEAGLRSFDRAMPEELNRCVIGTLADLHCAPTKAAVANLRREGVPADRITLTGNTIVEATLATAPGPAEAARIAAGCGAEPGRYVLATIHRPENTDDPRRLRVILDELAKLGLPVLFPLHPRTGDAVRRFGLAAGPGPAACAPPGRPPGVPRPGTVRRAPRLRLRRRPGGVHRPQAATGRRPELHRTAGVRRGGFRPPRPAGTGDR